LTRSIPIVEDVSAPFPLIKQGWESNLCIRTYTGE
jgi:hypothetical protein